MSKYLSIKHRINQDNTHLLDIFNKSYFLNLGVIDYKTLKKLLKYQIVSLDKLVYPEYLKDDDLKNSLIYFKNIARKDISMQLCISYGILSWKDMNNRQNFSPICLIPINLFLEDDKIFVQQVGNPIENTVLVKHLISINKSFLPLNEKLNSLYSLDKYCMSFQKNPELKVSLQNYLTFASLQTKEIVFDHSRFNIDKSLINIVGEQNILMDEEYGLNLFPLNIAQKNALVQAMAGNSFGIEGSLGTGKTTTLVNIALNAVGQGKRVLYISNLDQTLENVESIFSSFQLDNYLVNITKSFEHITTIKGVNNRFNSYDVNVIKESISQNYHFLDQYEKVMFSRVRNNHILDILNSLVILQGENLQLLDVDSLDNIYKHELEEIVSSLCKIEKYLIKFPDFKTSVWQNIPFTHNIKYPNQVITLIYKMHKHFRNLDQNQKKLSDEYGIKSYNSYIKIRELMNNVNHIRSVEIPSIWLEEDFSIFFQAQEYFPHLKNQLDYYHKTFNDIRYSYSLDALEIDYEELLNDLLGPYFTEEELSKLDELFLNRNQLSNLVLESNQVIESINRNLFILQKDLDWRFEFTDSVFRDINNLYLYISQNAYHPEWLKINTDHKFYRLIDEVLTIESKIVEIQKQIEQLQLIYPKVNLADLDKDILVVKKAINKEKMNLREKVLISRLDNSSLVETHRHFQQLINLRDSLNQLKERYLMITEFNYHPDSEILSNLENLYMFLKSINNKEHLKKIKAFLRKRNQHSSLISSSANNLQSLKDFSTYYQLINKYIETLKVYGFDFKNIFLEDISKINDINNYLIDLYANYDKFLQKTSLMDKTILVKDLVNLKNKKETLKGLKDELYNNPKYSELFGQLYDFEKTNIYSLEKIRKYFSIYIQSFIDSKNALLSFGEENRNNIQVILDYCLDDIESINELFKLYAKLFKDKISKYYYDSFSDNVKYLEGLLSSKDELILYLNITEELKVLIKYNLPKLIEYVISNEDQNISNSFKYTYYTNIWSEFIAVYPFLKNTKSIEKCLQICSNLEKDLLDSNLVKLRKLIYRNYPIQKIRWKKSSLDYDLFLKKTSSYKRVVLSNTKMLNHYLDIDQFDLVIIDDAHLSSSNEYYLAITGEQVVMAGEKDRDRLLKTNLISRMHEYNLLNLNYRYLPTPKNLLNTFINLPGLIPSNYFDNQGVIILDEDIIHYIYNLYLININYKINLFVRSYQKQQSIINQLILKFQESGILKANIYNIFSKNLNVVRLNSRLLFDADFNIIYLEEYYQEFTELNSLKMVNDLFTAKQKVVIFDDGNYLEKASPNKFFKRLQESVSQLEITYNEHILHHGLIGKLNEIFQRYNIRAVGSHNDIDLILENNDRLYGVLIFWDISTLNYQTFEKYRKFYEHFKKNNWKIFIVWIVDLVYNMDETIKKIAKEIKEDNGT